MSLPHAGKSPRPLPPSPCSVHRLVSPPGPCRLAVTGTCGRADTESKQRLLQAFPPMFTRGVPRKQHPLELELDVSLEGELGGPPSLPRPTGKRTVLTPRRQETGSGKGWRSCIWVPHPRAPQLLKTHCPVLLHCSPHFPIPSHYHPPSVSHT